MIRTRLAGLLAVGIGVALPGLDLLGTTSVGRYESRPPRPREHFDAALAEATPDLDVLPRVGMAEMGVAAHPRGDGRGLAELDASNFDRLPGSLEVNAP